MFMMAQLSVGRGADLVNYNILESSSCLSGYFIAEFSNTTHHLLSSLPIEILKSLQDTAVLQVSPDKPAAIHEPRAIQSNMPSSSTKDEKPEPRGRPEYWNCGDCLNGRMLLALHKVCFACGHRLDVYSCGLRDTCTFE
jgi:hypothetical protein